MSMINYNNILKENLLEAFKKILSKISEIGFSNNQHLYITFEINHINNKIPKWLKDKYSEYMTIILQYEFYDLKLNKNSFSVSLSFNNIFTNIEIDYKSVVSIADPSSNFGLILKNKEYLENSKKNNSEEIKNNVIDLKNFKKN